LTFIERNEILCKSCNKRQDNIAYQLTVQLKVKGTWALDECLKEYCKKEIIKGEQCKFCAEFETCQRTIKINKLPEILVV
jgi:ubiquitin C-terminal hydrolase